MVCDKVVCDREVGVTKMVCDKEMCVNVNGISKCHACHVKRRRMPPSATPATRNVSCVCDKVVCVCAKVVDKVVCVCVTICM